MLRLLRRGGVIAVALAIAWVVINPGGTHGLPWGWGEARGVAPDHCSTAVVRIHEAGDALRRSWPDAHPQDIAPLAQVAMGPAEGGVRLAMPSVVVQGNELVVTAPAGDYVWESLGTTTPCAGLLHIDAGRSTAFGDVVVRFPSSVATT